MIRYVSMLLLALVTSLAVKAQPFNATAELFLKINDAGRYTVSVDSQTISLPGGKFRFYELRAGRVSMSVSKNNIVLYKGSISVEAGQRLVAGYAKGSITVKRELDTYRNGVYALDDWDKYTTGTIVNQPGNGGSYPDIPPYPVDDRIEVMGPAGYSRLLAMVKNEPFKDGKVSIIKSALAHNNISVKQLGGLLQEFNFDDDKLKLATYAYRYVVDVQRFYQLRELFTFLSSKEQLDQFIQQQGS